MSFVRIFQAHRVHYKFNHRRLVGNEIDRLAMRFNALVACAGLLGCCTFLSIADILNREDTHGVT